MALRIQRFVCNMLQENCYVASDETHECVIVDCGAFYPEERTAISNYIKENNLVPKHLVCTHAHIDHNFGNNFILAEYGLCPEVCAFDKKLYKSLRWQAKAFVNIDYEEDIPSVGRFFSDGETIVFGTHIFKIICTPGHSRGSVVLFCEDGNIAFTGDTLFRGSIGRTDLGEGGYDDIVNSLHRLNVQLPPETVVLPGHGPETTIADEKRHNPYFQW